MNWMTIVPVWKLTRPPVPFSENHECLRFWRWIPLYQFSYINPQFFPSRFSAALGYVCVSGALCGLWAWQFRCALCVLKVRPFLFPLRCLCCLLLAFFKSLGSFFLVICRAWFHLVSFWFHLVFGVWPGGFGFRVLVSLGLWFWFHLFFFTWIEIDRDRHT